VKQIYEIDKLRLDRVRALALAGRTLAAQKALYRAVVEDEPAREPRLQFNPDPIRIVETRPGETRPLGALCEHEDGRGRCSSRDTLSVWNPAARRIETFCEKHESEFTRLDEFRKGQQA